MMRRREFIALLSSAVVTRPATVTAQQRSIPTIGYLIVGGPEDSQATLVPFLQGLKQTGYVQGGNVAIEARTADDNVGRLAALAADLVDHGVALIFATQGAASALAAKAATSTIPIVFATGADPIQLGLVSSLIHPGGNISGFSFLIGALGGKRLELLHDFAPKAKVIGFLAKPSNAASPAELADTSRR